MGKTAFVLSAGGSRGAIEAGVLLALLEANVVPDILIGSSVGAINGAAMAIRPDTEGARWLVDEWTLAARHNVFPINYASMSLRVMSGSPSLLGNSRLKNVLKTRVLRGVERFGDLKTELYIGAVRLDTGQLQVFGEDKDDVVLDAIMSSTAVVPFLPPWTYRGVQYVDSGFKSELPIRVAVDTTATDIYAIDVGVRRLPQSGFNTMFQILEQVLMVESYEHFLQDMGWSRNFARERFHYIGVPGFERVRLWDFAHSRQMIEMGRRAAADHLRLDSAGH